MRLLREIRARRFLDHEQLMWGTKGSDFAGMFWFHHYGTEIHVVASSDGGWDHVSVSIKDRCPTWEEMELVKRMFFRPTETAMQLHVPLTEHININPNVLHLWRPTDVEIPRPPPEMV